MTARYDFRGCRILVTGASRGIGYDIIDRLLSSNCHVIAIVRDRQSLLNKRQENNDGEMLTIVESDLHVSCASDGAFQQLKDELDKHQPIVGLVNNAGVAYTSSIADITDDQWEEMMTVNLKAPFRLSRYVCEQLKALANPNQQRNHSGSIVNISSAAGLLGHSGHLVYGATKAGLDQMTMTFAKEYGVFDEDIREDFDGRDEMCRNVCAGVRVNSICPTVVVTDMYASVWAKNAARDQLVSRIPLNRFGEVHDITSCVLFLLSDESKWITGARIPVDGGLTSSCV